MYKTRQRVKLIELENDLNNKKYSKDSFYRFGDDLCELILSYLSISDKLRYECVSKQWKSLIFNKQFKLKLKYFNDSYNESVDELLRRLLYRSNNYYNYFSKIRENLFTKLLKKFKFIKEIVFSSELLINNKILQIIGINCKYLEKITINRRGFDSVDEKHVKLFGEKCGQKLKSINFLNTTPFDSRENSRVLYDFTPNIKAFYFDNISIITSKPNNYYSKLEKIVFGRDSLAFEEFKQFADHYCKQIKEINLGFDHIISSGLSENIVKIEEFSQLSRFERLEVLELIINDVNMNAMDIEKGLVKIGNECKNVRKLCFTVYVEQETNLKAINKRFFKILSAFQALIRCEFTIDYEGNEVFLSYDNVETLKRCENMKHLKLEIPQLNDKHFEDFHLFVPNLKTIEIYTENRIISDKTLHNFAKLQHLSDLRVVDSIYDLEEEPIDPMLKITDSGVIDVIKSCPQIRRIDLSDRFCIITNKTIDAIMGLKLNPKIEYYFYFDDNTKGELQKYITSIETYLPKNLKFESFDSGF